MKRIAGIALLSALIVPIASAQTWPSKVVRVVTPGDLGAHLRRAE